jgi:Ca2+-dependent lipid-binding protein
VLFLKLYPSDPYVEVYFNYDLIHVTNYISNNNNPVWNEEIIKFNIIISLIVY